ncbi:MAG: hypothetical protein WBD03_06425, partial [Thermoplasmata archaeon]
MKWRTALAHKEGVPKRRWPERVNRAVVVFAVAALLVGTPIVSINAFSKHLDTQTIVVEPLSYRAIHFGFYGYGKLDFAYTGISESPIRFLQLDRTNFYRFQAGEDYDFIRSRIVSYGSGGGGGSSGSLWETYFVFVNEGTEPAALQFAAEAEAFFSLPVAGIMLGVAAIVGYANERNSAPRRPQEAEQISPRVVMTERRKAVIAAAGLVALLTAIVVITGLIEGILSGGPASLAGISWTLRLWFGTIVCTAIVFALKFKLSVVNGAPDVVLASLAHRLRVSGYRVSE